jgi:hypothetical protein
MALVPIDLVGVCDDLDILLWCLDRLGGVHSNDRLTAGGVPAIDPEEDYEHAWKHYCISIRRLSVRLNEGDIHSLDCNWLDRSTLEWLWDWLDKCKIEKPQRQVFGDQNLKLPATVHGDFGRDILRMLKLDPDENLVDLKPAQQRIVDVVRNAGRRLTTDEVLGQLGDVSVGVTKQTLAYLVQMRVLTNRRDSFGSGYGLSKWTES